MRLPNRIIVLHSGGEGQRDRALSIVDQEFRMVFCSVDYGGVLMVPRALVLAVMGLLLVEAFVLMLRLVWLVWLSAVRFLLVYGRDAAAIVNLLN